MQEFSDFPYFPRFACDPGGRFVALVGEEKEAPKQYNYGQEAPLLN